jgi:hypothetical protein
VRGVTAAWIIGLVWQRDAHGTEEHT